MMRVFNPRSAAPATSPACVPPDEHAWQRTLEHRWELVPVVIQDPIWERSFPDVGAVTVPYADPESGAVVPVYLTRAVRLLMHLSYGKFIEFPSRGQSRWASPAASSPGEAIHT